ncbi:MAG: hypothetical protein ACI4I3_04080 [Acutalibacteraceae bacterium]
MGKKLTAIILALAVLFTAFAIPAYAAKEVTSSVERGFYRVVDKVIDVLVGGISAMIKEPDWVNKKDFVSENFYEGLAPEEFRDEPANDSVWMIGYSNGSIQTGNELDGEHYVGGSLSVTKKVATGIRDDQKVRTVAISDGRGISIFSSIDCYGISNPDVRGIRAQFEEYAKANNINITAINISALHQHSCVDTFGLNGDLLGALFFSSFRNMFGKELPNGQNKEFMENLYNVTVNTMIDAVKDMQPGKLYFGTADAEEYMRDKRDPQVFDKNLNRLRFVPDAEGEKETWIVNGNIHCVGNGAAGTLITGDYPYYMEKYINENANANLFYILGAELALTSKGDSVEKDPQLVEEYGDRYAGLVAFGTTLGKLLCSINNDEPVEPIFNIRMEEIFVPVENNILKLAAKGGLLTNQIVKTGIGKYEVHSEIGYAEFGKNISVAIIPGEIAPEIVFGGTVSAAESWDGTEWNYPSFSEVAGNRKLIVFGITNDQIGYLLPDNEWHSYLTENEEIVSIGQDAGACIVEAYLSLYKKVR